MIVRAIVKGLIAAAILLAIYFSILTLVSGWSFAQEQFSTFWYFIISLALGFGIQIGLYVYLKSAIHANNIAKGVMVTTGSTSTLAMISCCAHYLVNILPVLGATGLVALVAQYQVNLFWLGITFNLLGIFYILNKILKFSQQSYHAA